SAQLACVYAVVFLATAVSRFFTPARLSIVADVVEPEKQPKAAGLGQATMALAGLIGPPLAAPLLFVTGIHWALLLDAASFAVSFAVIAAVRVPAVPGGPVERAPRAGMWREMAEGARAILNSRVLVALVVA